MKTYNLKIIDFGNGNKEVTIYKQPINICDDDIEKINYFNRHHNKLQTELTNEEIEQKEIHSFFSSANRTKNTVYKLARSNRWDYFITLTFDEKKVLDRTDYELLRKKITKWFNYLRERVCPDIKYILVPEHHKRIEKNGKQAFHFHGLISDCDGLKLRLLSDDEVKYYDIQASDDVYTIVNYKLGFCTATKVKNNDAVTKYITKYITKALSYELKNKARYLVSKNVNRPTEITYFDKKYIEPSYSTYTYGLLDDNVHLADVIDLTKIVYKSKKEININGFENTITYLQLKNEFSPIISKNKIVTIKGNL